MKFFRSPVFWVGVLVGVGVFSLLYTTQQAVHVYWSVEEWWKRDVTSLDPRPIIMEFSLDSLHHMQEIRYLYQYQDEIHPIVLRIR